MYLKQVEALLCLLASCRSGDLDAYVAAAENNIKYPFFFDLHHYSRLIPVHIQEMKEIKRNDPILWNELSVNFSVNKTGIPFCNLFGDQALEQHIKKLKDSGCLLGLTQSPETLQRLMFTSSFLGKIVNEFRNKTPLLEKDSTNSLEATLHVFMKTSRRCRSLFQCISVYCNPFLNGMSLRSIVFLQKYPVVGYS